VFVRALDLKTSFFKGGGRRSLTEDRPFFYKDKVVSDGAGFACGRPSFGIAQKKAKTDLGLPP